MTIYISDESVNGGFLYFSDFTKFQLHGALTKLM